MRLEAGAVLVDAYLAHHSLDSIFETTVTQAMHQVGDLWLKGSVTVADEHIATRVVLTAIQKLRGVMAPHEPNGLTAICCTSEGDLHELPVHLVELILESKGWNVINLGANTPLFSLQEMVSGAGHNWFVYQLVRSQISIERLRSLLSYAGSQIDSRTKIVSGWRRFSQSRHASSLSR